MKSFKILVLNQYKQIGFITFLRIKNHTHYVMLETLVSEPIQIGFKILLHIKSHQHWIIDYIRRWISTKSLIAYKLHNIKQKSYFSFML